MGILIKNIVTKKFGDEKNTKRHTPKLMKNKKNKEVKQEKNAKTDEIN